MAEFILLTVSTPDTDVYDFKQVLVNTDNIAKIEQRVENGDPTTYLMYKNGDRERINESISQVMTALAAPVGRYYALTAFGGGYSSFQPAQYKAL